MIKSKSIGYKMVGLNKAKIWIDGKLEFVTIPETNAGKLAEAERIEKNARNLLPRFFGKYVTASERAALLKASARLKRVAELIRSLIPK